MMHVEPSRSAAPSADHPAGHAGKTAATRVDVDEAVVAAIALALELESQPEASKVATTRGPSAWALAGRARVLRGR
jgi:hypothetical protein